MNQEGTTSNLASNDVAAPATASPLYATPPGLARPLRVTLVMPQRIPAWLSTFLDMASATGWIDVSVLPVTGATLPTVAELPIDVRAFLAFERARRRWANATLSTVAIGARDGVTVAPEVRVNVEPAQLTARVRALQPDLVLSLGPPGWSEFLVDCAPWGCWNLDASLVDPDRAGTALLAPMLKDESATEIELELHSASLAPIGLVASWGSTRFGSFNLQREKSFLKLPMLLLRALHRLAADDLRVPRQHLAQLRLAPPKLPLGFAAGARALAITLYRGVQWQLQKRRRTPPWFLVLRQDHAPLDPGAPEVRSSPVALAPPGIEWADPCVVEASGRQLVFVEEVAPTGKGVIACLELRPGAVRRLGLALEEPVHTSYPQVFRWNAEWYMTVESSGLRRVSLYKATTFPLGWCRIRDLIRDRVCVDPTLHFHQGHWYLFANIAENGNSTWDELFLFVSDHLEGPFQPHPANPIVSDVRRARPAGRLFQHGGKLVRPAQDCASCYGSAIAFNDVLELSPSRYRERPLSRLAPDWSASLGACHTYSAAGGVEVLDARGYPSAATPRLSIVDVPFEEDVATLEASEQQPGGVPLHLGGAVDAL